MSKALELTGKRFGRLTALKIVGKRGKSNLWRCICDCGNETEVSAGDLNSGHSKSCRCYHPAKHGYAAGGKVASENSIWSHIKARCYNSNNPAYKNYGGRGIKVCDRWLNSFENFIADMGNRPTKKHSIDRIDNDKGYSPDNCRWATDIQQNRNTRKNRWIEYGDKRMILTDWAKYLNTSVKNVHKMLKRKNIKEVCEHYIKQNIKQ